MSLPGIFEPTIFSGRRPLTGISRFIQPMHPKTEIQPTRASIQRVLQAGWIGQLKVHGHRAQIHIPADDTQLVQVYTRQGQLHKMRMPESMVKEVRRLFTPQSGWNVIDAEWLKGENRLFAFDFLKRNGELLDDCTYIQRYELLPRVYRSDCIETLPLIKTIDECLATLERKEPWVEGLVFKSSTTIGFSDTAVVRCRIKGLGRPS